VLKAKLVADEGEERFHWAVVMPVGEDQPGGQFGVKAVLRGELLCLGGECSIARDEGVVEIEQR
jgi:hypothetical protein